MTKTAAEKKLKGTLKKSREKETLELPAVTESFVPEGLINSYAIEEWNAQTKLLIDGGVFSECDTTMLLMYCNEVGIYFDSIDILRKKGNTIKFKKSDYENVSPHFTIKTKAFEIAYKLAKEFGLTPLARTKIEVEKKKKDIDPLANL